MSRPTKLTPEIQEKICNAIRAGNYIETAAAYSGVAKSTVFDWMRRGAREKERVGKNTRARIRKKEVPYVEFSDAVEKALADAEVIDVDIIRRAAKENWQAAAWRLERKFPDRWGRREKVEADVSHSGKVTERHEYDITQRIVEDPESRELARQLFRRTVAEDMGDGRKE